MKTLETIKNKDVVVSKNFFPYTPLDFSEIDKRAKDLADIIEAHFEDLAEILLEYESYEVVKDETDRTLDLLRNLKENKKYFKLRVGAVATFLPRNQPLYTFVCFVIIPALMASEVHFRIPHSVQHFFKKVLTLLDIHKLFPNVIVSSKERLEFLKERSALLVDSKTNEYIPTTDVVIFTGTSIHADQLRTIFDKRTLFITNGAGHNPMVISNNANIFEATEAALTLVLYNQGQDCSAPNAILVHKDIYDEFTNVLYKEIKKVKIGPYRDRSCKVGPITDPEDLKRIEALLVDNREWLDKRTLGIIRTAEGIVEPAIINKPLSMGGNYTELFAPIFFIQKYEFDNELASYFENQHYAHNAMNISLYGKSVYLQKIIGKLIEGKVLHSNETLLYNTHPHAFGIERGTQQYGGYGIGTSSISIKGEIMPMPTLPQRDIYEYIAKPILRKKTNKKEEFAQFTEIEYKNVQKLLRLQPSKMENDTYADNSDSVAYFDLSSTKTSSTRYVKINENNTYYLLNKPNVKHIATLRPEDIKMIQNLINLLDYKTTTSLEKFRSLVYAIPKDKKASEQENKIRQIHFFQHIYQLLFGEKSGPQLASFLLDVEQEKIKDLLVV